MPHNAVKRVQQCLKILDVYFEKSLRPAFARQKLNFRYTVALCLFFMILTTTYNAFSVCIRTRQSVPSKVGNTHPDTSSERIHLRRLQLAFWPLLITQVKTRLLYTSRPLRSSVSLYPHTPRLYSGETVDIGFNQCHKLKID